MIAEPILVLAWLVLAHLVADFLLQTTRIVVAKTSSGGRAWRGLAAHGLGVGVCLIPIAVAFGVPGLWALVAITASHFAIDRTKVVLTRRAEARALAGANRRHEGRAPAAGLGRAWTPLPAAYFALDQVAHLAVLAAAWAVWLAGQPPTLEWAAAVTRLTGSWPLDVVHDVVLGTVVIVSLVIANVRGGALLVGTLVRPLEVTSDVAAGSGDGGETDATPGPPGGADSSRSTTRSAAPAQAAASTVMPAGRGWSFRLGPLEGRVSEDPPPAPPSRAAATVPTVAGERVAMPPPAQVGATIGVIERLLIVIFVLVGADAAIGFVVGAKTIARFRQLDDRDFAEYYLLGTLASVSIAILTAIVARAALSG